MGTVRKTITLTNQQDDWLKVQVDAGHFVDDSAYIADLIQRDQARSAETEAIRAALIEGETSGEPAFFDAAAFKRRMLASRG